ncbi:arrestin homolog [Copidosoma floridanum]|uniref:arrestin homolog n=1 Tax=Copidosoma floridanum TaxID=29053 RepID=UPI0006C9B1B8|nr:arrestin homolog [Copidosoma floridanum]
MSDAKRQGQGVSAPATPTASTASDGAFRSLPARPNSESLARKALHQSAESARTERRLETSRPSEPDTGFIFSQKAFKKSSQNGKLTLYLASRDLIVTAGKIDKLQGVLLIDPDMLQGKKVYGQVILTFRYGREDEEVMGLKFCNEAIMALAQLYPPYHPTDPNTPFQEVLIKRFYPNAHPFAMSVTPLAPPSVQLVPAKEYNGAPIGTSYDIRVYVADRPDEKLTRKMQIIRMGLRVIQGPPPTSIGAIRFPSHFSWHPHPPASLANESSVVDANKLPREKSSSCLENENEIKSEEEPIPHAVVEKQFLLSDGRVRLEASLDRANYSHGDAITVSVNVVNNSGKSVKRIEVDIVQHVDVCMFSNGKFKNVVAQLSPREDCPVEPGFSLSRTYVLRPEKGSTKNWIALEDDPGYPKGGGNLASTVVCKSENPEDRNVFAIYVSYYVKVKLVVSPMGEWIGGVVSLKLPFTLMHTRSELETLNSPSPPYTPSRILEKIETIDDLNDDSLPFIDKDSTSDEDNQNDSPDKHAPDAELNTTSTTTHHRTARNNEGTSPTTTTTVVTASVKAAALEDEGTGMRNKKRRESMANVDLIERFDEPSVATRRST